MSGVCTVGTLEVWAFLSDNGWEWWHLRTWQSGYEVCWHAV